MKANKRIAGLIMLVLTVALMFSLFSVSVFAETSETTAEVTEAGTDPVETGDETGNESGNESDTKGNETTKAPVTSGAATTSAADAAAKKTKLIETIVSLCIVGVTAIIVAIFCIIKREKVAKFFRAIKSEMKKIVWLPWKQVRKNTIVVIIAVIIIAIIIGVLDFAFSNGINVLHGLFN